MKEELAKEDKDVERINDLIERLKINGSALDNNLIEQAKEVLEKC